MTVGTRFWLRWSGRDLRRRWPQVAAIAMIIALGSGVYSGLSSTSEWRRASYDASYAALHMYDLRIATTAATDVDADALVAAIFSIPDASSLAAVEPRLVAPTQVDASHDGTTILVPGRIVGVDVTAGGPHVAGVYATEGRTLRASDAGAPLVVLDDHFAEHYDLPARGALTLSGGHEVRYVGRGLSPEYFMITGEQGGLLAQANYAVVFTSLATAQSLAGRTGAANEAVLRLQPGADRATVELQVRAALKATFPAVGFTVNARARDAAYRMLYDDIEGDQRFYDIFAMLVLLGAAFAAFNLTGRIVDAQRREIGIGMAMGAPSSTLAVRPLLVGAEIAILGVVLGVGVGLVIGQLMAGVLEGFLPLPAWVHPFQWGAFVRGAALGLALPFVATIIPVWRAVRVAPVDAIRTAQRGTRGGRLVRALARVPLPGRSTAQMPLRNVLRAPRRTTMTLLGVAAALVVLIGVVGMVDSFYATIDRVDTEVLRTSPDRLTVDLATFLPVESAEVQAVRAAPVVQSSAAFLRVGGTLRNGTARFDVLLQLVDFHGSAWQPTVLDPHPTTGAGIVISQRAADDLGVAPGDTVKLRHPLRDGTSYRFMTSEVPVVGITPIPVRFTAFMDLEPAAALMNLSGITNTLIVAPAPGVTTAAAQRALFTMPGVGSVQPVSALTDSVRSQLGRMLDLLTVVEGAVLLLALLIAFNSSSINADERRRENATMFAFGLPLRSVVRMEVVESMVIGVLGTLVGLALGRLLLGWLIGSLLPETFPDIGVTPTVSTATLVTAVVLGVVAVAIAPLFTIRKLRRMDVPSTLRVVE
jgi:putative ABC transport system permease protein